MNIAILMFGQPRFFTKTWPLIKEEFNFGPYEHNVEYFAHFWDKVGYVPLGQEDNYNTEVIDIAINEPKFRKFTVEKYNGEREVYNNKKLYTNKKNNNGLDVLCDTLYNYYKLINFPTEGSIETLRYRFGQHYSIQQAYSSIKQYEKDYSNEINKNFKYDIIIKIRTDLLYRPECCFKNTELYYRYKNEYYTSEVYSNGIKCNALRFLDLTNKMDDPNGKPITTQLSNYKNKKYRTLKTQENGIHTEEYPTRLCLNDWTLIAGREAADIYFDKWFENFHLTACKDIKLSKTRKKLICGSEHSLQGQFLLNYDNLQAQLNKMRRDVRLLHINQIKPDVDKIGKLLINENTSTEELRKMVAHHYRKK